MRSHVVGVGSGWCGCPARCADVCSLVGVQVSLLIQKVLREGKLARSHRLATSKKKLAILAIKAARLVSLTLKVKLPWPDDW